MAAAATVAVDAGHKVRGGSALSAALARASPTLNKASPADSDGSVLSKEAAAWLSSSAASTLTPSPELTDAAGLAAAQQSQPQPQHGDQQPPAAAAAAAAAQQQQQPSAVLPPPPQLRAQSSSHSRRLFPFLSCFGAGGGGAVGDDPSTRPATAPAVSASEVGIRPCFYWLEGNALSEEDRQFAEANARWLKSDCQDDAVVIEHFAAQAHQTFAGVFDGHGPYGRAAAKFAATRLPQALAARVGGAGASERKRLRALRDAFIEVNAGMQDMRQSGFDASLSGTTACCVLVVGRKVLVASTGDSRCVVARRRAGASAAASAGTGSASAEGGSVSAALDSTIEVVPLTWDAKPSLPEEEKRIAMAGGVVKQLLDEQGQRVGAYRVFSRGDDVLPGLAMSRSLGDLYAHEVGVCAEPVLNTYTLGERDLFLMLATDGLWDIMGNEEAADFVERYKLRRDVHVSCAEALTLEAQERWKQRHDEAIVDDISCVILHTAGLPPAARDSSVPRPLARAASCNDEANELYQRWRLEKERNPSNHRPKQYFKHLYGEQGAEEESSEPSTSAAVQQQQQQQQQQGQPAAASRAVEAPASPASPLQLRDAPQYSSGGSGGGGLAALPPPAFGSGLQACRVRSAGGGSEAGLGLGSSGTLHRMDDISSQSPHSSFGDFGSESEPSTRRGGAFSPTFGGSANDLQWRSSGAQPIPIARSRRSAGEMGGPMSLPLDTLLRPVRKAYPSTSNIQQLASYRSDASGLAQAETPRSGEGGADLEHKVRGGLSRSVSMLAVPSPLGVHSMPAHPSHTSLSAWEQRVAGTRRPGGSSGRLGGRLASDSSLGSPGGESTLGSAPALSPQHLSPAAGGGGLAASASACSASYSRLLASPSHGGTRVQALPPLALADLQGGGALAAALHVRTADAVAHATHLSRTTTDTAGLLQAVSTLERASATAAAAATAQRRP